MDQNFNDQTPNNQPNPNPYTTPLQATVPPQYKPLGAWAYFGYSLLFSLPVVGFILLLVFSFNDDNINRRNFARSHFCMMLVIAVVAVLAIIAVFSLGFSVYQFNFLT